jgi:hypothetical protein
MTWQWENGAPSWRIRLRRHFNTTAIKEGGGPEKLEELVVQNYMTRRDHLRTFSSSHHLRQKTMPLPITSERKHKEKQNKPMYMRVNTTCVSWPVDMNGLLDSSPFTSPSFLDQIRDVHRHLLDLSRIKLLNVAHHPNILCGHKVDCDTNISKLS